MSTRGGGRGDHGPGPSSGYVPTSLLEIADHPTPRSVISRPSAASPATTCLTYGQWLQMKVTTRAGPVSSSRLTVVPGGLGQCEVRRRRAEREHRGLDGHADQSRPTAPAPGMIASAGMLWALAGI